MNYHNITKDDMLNGDGLRVVLWVAGCSHHCPGCQNPSTWDPKSGIPFDEDAEKEIFDALDADYISGITFSGGDPMHEENVATLLALAKKIRERYGDKKTIWLYTGYTLEEILSQTTLTGALRRELLSCCNVLVDGRFDQSKADINYPWAGSTNQNVYYRF